MQGEPNMLPQRTPPNKYSSNPDLRSTSDAVTSDESINLRKRKQPERYDLDQQMEFFEEKWNQKIEKIISETVSASIKTALASDFARIADSLQSINSTVNNLRDDNADLKQSFENLNTRFVDMEASLTASCSRQDGFEQQLKTLENKISLTVTLPERVQKLENKLAAMEQHARDTNIEVSNIPERRNENLVHIMLTIGTTIKQQILSSDIVSVHRVPHADQSDNRPKNIIVKFTTRVLRDNVLAAGRAFKGLNTEVLGISGSSHKVYLNEHLTLKNKQLFRECRIRATAHNFKYVWVKHGVILARKSDTSPVIAMRSDLDISKIK